MAHIPYGYRIRGGSAEIDEIERERILLFFRAYLDGYSILDSGGIAGIELSRAGLGKILSNEVYLGDAYYPALVPAEVFRQAQEERARRFRAAGEPDRSKRPDVTPPGECFSLDRLQERYEDPVRDAEYIYSRIRTDRRKGRDEWK